MLAKPQRRWYQFSLRMLLVLTTIAGFGLGYVGYERRLAQHQHEIEAALTKHGIKLLGMREDSRPDWLKSILGDDSAGRKSFVLVRPGLAASSPAVMDQVIANLRQLPNTKSLVFEDTQLGDKGLGHFRGLTQLQFVSLNKTQVTDVGLLGLREFKSLKQLNLMQTQTSDAGLREIAHHQDLETLGLGGTKVTDAGLQELVSLRKLKWLNLADTRVTDKGLEQLRKFPALQELVLRRTLVSENEVAKLQRALPNLMIVHESLPQNVESPIFWGSMMNGAAASCLPVELVS